jgi:DNA mismatch repair protein MutL
MTNNQERGRQNWIRPLPERLVNKIAAGEVIERPAAVLKELVENSLDAGATRIEIIIEKSGTKLISVIDNGCGVEPEQIEIAFARHATSKISNFDDLENLRSYGFRGEALPSIGSVSRTRMVSKTDAVETGREIIIEGGVVQSIKPISAPNGTRVEVGELFFNTPARRKFLKAETTEARHLTRNAIALALSAPAVRFSYTLNGRNLFSLDDSHSNLMRRTAHLILGKDNARLAEIVSDTEGVKIVGFLGYPEQCRQNQYGLYLFINNRYIRSQTIMHAVMAGYGELLPRGQYPSGAVFLNIEPTHVDVNVHPTKTEVRLSDEKMIHDLLYHAVKRSFRQSLSAISPSANNSESAPMMDITAAEAIRRLRETGPVKVPDSTLAHLKELYGNNKPAPETNIELPIVMTDSGLVQTGGQETYIRSASKPGDKVVTYLGQFAGLYLVYTVGEGLLIIDQHAAHERVLYEENLKVMESGRAVSQNLLFPVNVELSPDRYALYEESSEILRAAGFSTDPFGSRTILLSAVPSTLSKKSPEKLFLSIIDDVEIIRRAEKDIKKVIAQSMACRAAIMAGDRITSEEALSLLNNLMATENRHCCPHGRPTIITLTKGDLDDRFGRK